MRRTRRAWRLPTFDSWRLALAIVLLAALAVRLYGLDWDEGADLHPDELFVARIVLIDRIHLDWPPDLATLFDPARSGLNPRSADPATGQFREFAYGALPLWVTDAVAWALSRLTGTNWNAADHAYLVGRAISALLSALTILPIAGLGTMVGGRAVGLLAALFAALAPMSIQLAHFFTTDSWLAFFVALCLLLAARAARIGTTRRFAAAGAAMGLAMATKGSVFALAAPIVVAAAIDLTRRLQSEPRLAALRAAVARGMIAAICAFVAFFAFEPYALLRPDVYLQSLGTQADIVSGRFDVPFTRVYVGTTPLLYQLEQFVLWGYGPATGLLAVAGVVLLGVLALRRSSPAALVLLSWLVVYGGVLLVAEVKFLRYLEPLAPVLAVAAGLALVTTVRALRGRWGGWPARLIAPAAVALALLWSAAFLSIYAHENTRVAATKWIYSELPAGATLTAEFWDDSLPRALDYALSPPAFGYGMIIIDSYRDLPPEEASATLFDALSRADYVVQSSTRVEAAVDAAPWRYPVQERFFDLLRMRRLGFTRVAAFDRAPSLGPIVFDDRRGDESFINYDHPRVTIYERAGPLSRADYEAEMSWALQRPWEPARHPARQTLLLDTPVGENPSVDDARWSAALTGTTPGAAAVWLILLVLLAVAGAPWTRLALGRFPERGFGFARILALLVAAWPVWLGASLQLFRYRAVWAALSLVVTAALGWWLAAKFAPQEQVETAPWRWRPALHAEVAFWAIFALFLAFRLINPDGWHPVWGGEKPMEFAQINAIGRSAYFPPYDPWFADGYINYYYYGFYLVSWLFKVTGIPAELGFNLALPTVMGMLASGVYSVVAALSRGVTRSRAFALAGGWIGVLAVCLLGNLSALRTLFSAARPALDSFVLWTWNGSRAIDFAITEFPYFSGLYADLHSHVVALPITVTAIALCAAIATGAYGHARLDACEVRQQRAATATRLALLALTLGALSATNAWDVPVYALLAVTSIFMATARIKNVRRRIVAFLAGAAAVAAGTWLLFLPFHAHFVALFGSLALVHTPTDLAQFLSHLGGIIAVASIGLTTLLLPRARRERAMPWPLLPLALAAAGFALFALWPGSLGRTVAALLVGAALAAPPLAAAWSRLALLGQNEAWARFAAYGVPVSGLAAAAIVASGRAVLGLLLALGVAAGIGWLALRRSAERFACLLLAAGFFTAAGAEVVVVADDLIGSDWYRMNTIFKFYNQVWVLLGVAAATLVALMLRDVVAARARASRRVMLTKEASRLHGDAMPVSRDPEQAQEDTSASWRDGAPAAGRLGWGQFGVVMAALVFLGELTYPALATGPRLAQRFAQHPPVGTLDAEAWMAEGTVPSFGNGEDGEIGYAGDADAIAWLWQNVHGSPVVAEASIGPYRCNGSRISAATGLPTIIGWERHEQQQRYPADLPPRVADVRTLYTSPDPEEKAAILRRYNVEYVVVGDLERRYPIADNTCTPTGSAEGIAAFDQMVGKTLEVTFSSRGTTIYRVLPVSGS
ncbi:MAG: glycosyltransferase family 39 protein [Thermomicrobiales bacterium]|nr:glycosyltransferase family 39 protein [Thermomicrobiales bacterium]